MGSDFETRIRHVTAVLGPTNTGKTHLAIERMLGHDSGMIGLPLRLLAREVYDKIAARVGADKVALVTGEEKIKPERAKYWVSTVEAMPRDVDVDFLAIDEIQLAADFERGHVFTDRLLHARGKKETLLLGAQTMREAIQDLIPGANFISRPRLSKLSYAGEKKITRLPPRSAVIAFSANDVYSIAELVRRQRGGTAVVLGALSPRTRNAQVALYQSGDVDFLVATDAIGMGLNLDVDHVAFSALRKFDGHSHRNLTPSEMGQIAGRAGRHMNDGTFGVTGSADAPDADTIERLETHTFDPVRVLQWRNRKIEFATLERLHESLRELPREPRLTRARMADDVTALETLSNDREIIDYARSPAAVATLWDVCQIPDYRKISTQNHAELCSAIYKYLMSPEGRVPEDWIAKQVAFADRTDGDIDTLANRIAHIRTWTFVANRANWLKDPAHWQARTREIEDALSDALHGCLTQRFVDKRTSALMRGMRDKEELNAVISDDGAIQVEDHFVGRLKGFRFSPDTHADGGIHGKAARNAAAHVLSRELALRARRVAAAKADAFKITRQGKILWRDEEIARLEAGADPLKPSVSLLTDEHLSGPDKEKVQARLDTFISELVADKLKPLADLGAASDIAGLGRGIAFRLIENFGVLKRETIAEEIKSLDQNSRAQLRKYGVRFGAFNIYIPAILKPAAAELSATLWTLKHAQAAGLSIDALPEPPRAGLTSVAADAAIPEAFYRAYGFHVCGPRAVRLDILERLADQIRPLLAWRTNPEAPAMPPKGSTGDGAFTVTPDMMSILGCSPDELGNVLRALGFRSEKRPVKVLVVEHPAPASETSVAPIVETAPEQAAETPAAAAESEVAVPEAVADVASTGTVETAAAPVSSEAPAAETSPATDAALEPAAVAKAEEEKFEEIWRPRRHRHEREQNRGPRRDRGQHNRRPNTQQGAAQTVQAAPANGTAAPAAEGTTTPVATDQAAQPPRERHDRDRGDRRPQGDKREGGRRDGEKRQDRSAGGRPGGDRGKGSFADRKGGGGGGDRRRRDEQRGPPEVRHAAPPRKTGTADPDSPFASLGALREALEKRTKEKSP